MKLISNCVIWIPNVQLPCISALRTDFHSIIENEKSMAMSLLENWTKKQEKIKNHRTFMNYERQPSLAMNRKEWSLLSMSLFSWHKIQSRRLLVDWSRYAFFLPTNGSLLYFLLQFFFFLNDQNSQRYTIHKILLFFILLFMISKVNSLKFKFSLLLLWKSLWSHPIIVKREHSIDTFKCQK